MVINYPQKIIENAQYFKLFKQYQTVGAGNGGDFLKGTNMVTNYYDFDHPIRLLESYCYPYLSGASGRMVPMTFNCAIQLSFEGSYVQPFSNNADPNLWHVNGVNGFNFYDKNILVDRITFYFEIYAYLPGGLDVPANYDFNVEYWLKGTPALV